MNSKKVLLVSSFAVLTAAAVAFSSGTGRIRAQVPNAPQNWIADGTDPLPRPPVLVADGTDPLPRTPVLVADGTDPLPRPPVLVADGTDPLPTPPVLA